MAVVHADGGSKNAHASSGPLAHAEMGLPSPRPGEGMAFHEPRCQITARPSLKTAKGHGPEPTTAGSLKLSTFHLIPSQCAHRSPPKTQHSAPMAKKARGSGTPGTRAAFHAVPFQRNRRPGEAGFNGAYFAAGTGGEPAKKAQAWPCFGAASAVARCSPPVSVRTHECPSKWRTPPSSAATQTSSDDDPAIGPKSLAERIG